MSYPPMNDDEKLQMIAVALVDRGIVAMYIRDHSPYIELPGHNALAGIDEDDFMIEKYAGPFVDGDVTAVFRTPHELLSPTAVAAWIDHTLAGEMLHFATVTLLRGPRQCAVCAAEGPHCGNPTWTIPTPCPYRKPPE